MMDEPYGLSREIYKRKLIMEPIEDGSPNKKLKGEEGWIVVRKKEAKLTIAMADHSKTNKYYSHKSIQNYLRYLLLQTCPNPMWLLIRRQSLIEHILYIDFEVENRMFASMLAEKQLSFLSSLANESNRAVFKASPFLRTEVWNRLLSYEDKESDLKEVEVAPSTELTEAMLSKYAKHVLSEQELKANLYPTKELPVYADYYETAVGEVTALNNMILVVDCEMVTTKNGFELARATIINYVGDILYDQFFKPEEEILNYNTEYSGITKEILDPVENRITTHLYPIIAKIVSSSTILIGHSLENDLNAMKVVHRRVIDTSVLYMRRNGSKLKLKNLSERILNRRIQVDTHDSLQDCLATLHLVQAKIEHQVPTPRQFHMLTEIISAKKGVVVVDNEPGTVMKESNAVHYEQLHSPTHLFKNIEKYYQASAARPALALARVHKHQEADWKDHYSHFNQSFRELYEQLPPFTAIFLNCQINTSVAILFAGQENKSESDNRPFCYILAK